jgi:hypothetical protein
LGSLGEEGHKIEILCALKRGCDDAFTCFYQLMSVPRDTFAICKEQEIFTDTGSASPETGGGRSRYYFAQDSGLITGANGPVSEHDVARESVKLGVRGHEIEIPHLSLASSVAFPKEVFKFSYFYKRPDKSISSVTIDLGDYSRRVSVTGEAADQVESISKSLENDLRRYSKKVGGATFRRVVGVCLSLGLLTSVGLSGAYWWRTRACDALGILICSAIGLSLVLLVPWKRYLPGFALYQSYSPFRQICASDLSPEPCCSSPRNSIVVFPSAMQSLSNRSMQITANDTFGLAPGNPLC